MIYGEKFLTEAKTIDPKKEKIVTTTIRTLDQYFRSNKLGSKTERQIYGTLSQISNNSFLKGNGKNYTYYVLSNWKDNNAVFKLLKSNKEEVIKKIESSTNTKVTKFTVINTGDNVADGRWYINVKIDYEIDIK